MEQKDGRARVVRGVRRREGHPQSTAPGLRSVRLAHRTARAAGPRRMCLATAEARGLASPETARTAPRGLGKEAASTRSLRFSLISAVTRGRPEWGRRGAGG